MHVGEMWAKMWANMRKERTALLCTMVAGAAPAVAATSMKISLPTTSCAPKARQSPSCMPQLAVGTFILADAAGEVREEPPEAWAAAFGCQR